MTDTAGLLVPLANVAGIFATGTMSSSVPASGTLYNRLVMDNPEAHGQ